MHDIAPNFAPIISDYPNAVVGDILLNINPDMSKPELQFASWICVELASGAKIFKGMEKIF